MRYVCHFFVLVFADILLMNGKVTAKISKEITWEKFLSRHDLVWESMPKAWCDAPFMDNGMLESMFYQQDDQHLRIDVGRSDVEDHQKTRNAFVTHSRLPIGYFTLKTKGKITGYDGRLDLFNAEANGHIFTTEVYTESQSRSIISG